LFYVLFVCKCVLYYCHRVSTQFSVNKIFIVLFYVLFVCKCVLYYCHRVATQFSVNKIYHIICLSS